MPKVFVYGTLKLGGRLNPVLASAKFLGHVVTADATYNLVGGSSFPFMKREENGFHIRGDLYEVSEATLNRLDGIEGYHGPGRRNFYERETISVMVADGIEDAFVYLCDYHDQGEDGIVYHDDNSKEWIQP